jgi:hypothetical protein
MDALSCKLVNVVTSNNQKYFAIDIYHSDSTVEHRLYLADIEQDELMVHEDGTPDYNLTNMYNNYDVNNKVIIHNMYNVADEYEPIKCRGYAYKNKNDLNENDSTSYSDIFAPNPFSCNSICDYDNYMFMLTNKDINGGYYEVDYSLFLPSESKFLEFTETITEPIYTSIFAPSASIVKNTNNNIDKFAKQFLPKLFVDNISYNHIYEMPTNKYPMFKDNTILANAVIGKNHLGYDYSQHSDVIYNSGEISNYVKTAKFSELRTYKRMFTCEDGIYLVYSTDTSATTADITNVNGLTQEQAGEEKRPAIYSVLNNEVVGNEVSASNISKLYPEILEHDYLSGPKYEHIECLKSVNRFGAKASHKTNLYSIEINNLGLNTAEQVDNPELKKIVSHLKKSVVNGVRKLCEKVEPGNTQLFNVYFRGN